jgi:hypothetical protein
VKTFIIKISEEKYNETEYAAAATKHLNTEYHEIDTCRGH